MKVLLFMAISIAQCLSVSGLALAQCPPTDHVYIDPRLVPHRPHYTEEQIRDLLSNPGLSEEAQMKFLSQYHEQD